MLMLVCMLALVRVLMLVFVLYFWITWMVMTMLSFKVACLLSEQLESKDKQQSHRNILYPRGFKVQPLLEQDISDNNGYR